MPSPKHGPGLGTSRRQYRLTTGAGDLTLRLDTILSDISLRLDSIDAIAQSSDHMGGKIINLGDGVSPMDAVNLRQLQAESRSHNMFYFFMGSGGING